MRNEKEMLEMILNFAGSRTDIRAVVMNGSRVNPNVRRDLFQDYDIACYVEDVSPYRRNLKIPPLFGELLMMQTPDDMGNLAPKSAGDYAYLMLFMDGNRIDLSFHPLDQIDAVADDSLSLVLIDKDNRIDPLLPPSDRSYLPKKPTLQEFADCCNEFWWLNAYAAKGLWRNELTYARYMLDTLMRGELMEMLTWAFGVNTNFSRAAGKLGKYLRSQMSQDQWTKLESTYARGSIQDSWSALFAMDDLFRETGEQVAQFFGYPYPREDDQRMSAYIRQVYRLPADAESM